MDVDNKTIRHFNTDIVDSEKWVRERSAALFKIKFRKNLSENLIFRDRLEISVAIRIYEKWKRRSEIAKRYSS